MRTGAAVSHQPCAEEAGFDFNEILAIANSDFAIRQQLSFEQLSSKFFFSPKYVINYVNNMKFYSSGH